MTAIEEQVKVKLKGFKPKSQKINLYNYNFCEKSNLYFTFKDDFNNAYKVFVFDSRILLETKVQSSLLFAVNIPDKICFADNEFSKTVDSRKVYINKVKELSDIEIAINLISAELRQLSLAENEAVFVYGNQIQFLLEPSRTLVSELRLLAAIKAKIDKTLSGDDILVDFSGLPEDLKILIPFLQEWAISDDIEREEKIRKTSKARLDTLIKTSVPKMAAINKYLDSFRNNALSEEAILIGNFAELISELTLQEKNQ